MSETTGSGVLCRPIHPAFPEAQNCHASYNGSQSSDRRASHFGEWHSERRDEKMEKRALEVVMNVCPQICPKTAAADLKILLKSHSYFDAINLAVDRICAAGLPETSDNNHVYDGIPVDKRRSARNSFHETRQSDIGNCDFPDRSKNQACSSTGASTTTKGKEIIDLTLDSDEENNGEALYQEWCIYRLAEVFPRAPLPYLKETLTQFGGKLIPTYGVVAPRYQGAKLSTGAECSSDHSGRDDHGDLTFLENDRAPRAAPNRECPLFLDDWNQLVKRIPSEPKESAVKCMEKELASPSDDIPANPVDDLDEYWDEVEKEVRDETRRHAPPKESLEECGCCYAELPFNKFVQCADGHLFCTDCLRRHVEGMIFGPSQSSGLPLCMETQGCDKTFPWSEVRKALPVGACSKYEQRLAEYEVARAKIDGLVYCPFCNHPWEVDPGMIVLRCLNEKCKKASCLKCKEPNHLPKDCTEVEMASETAMRRKVEEQMSKALIRECTKCRAELVKNDGCNKITCPCGQMMCYLCRKAISDYYHFCQHTRSPEQPCSQCSGCLLWEVEDEFEKVKDAKRNAIEEVAQQGAGIFKRDIGPSEYNYNRKKRRTGWTDQLPTS